MKEFQRLVDQGNAALRSKNYDEADKAFQRALRLFPNDAAAQQGSQDAQKQLKQAKTEYTMWMFRGNAAVQAGRIADAVLAFREATKLLPSDETAARALRQAEALQDTQAGYARAMETATLAMTARRFADAVVAYTEALRVVPNDPPALLGLADAQAGLDRDLLRRKDFDRHAFSGLQLLKAQKYTEAAAELRAALKAMPRNPDSITVERQLRYADAMASATAALNARRYSDAIAQFQVALAEFPGDFAAMSGLNRARQLNKGGKS